MAKSIKALVEPSVLRWARETVGLVPVAAARKIDVPDERVELWEAGTVQPTIAELRRAAKVYKRPLAVFFLAEPPQDFDTLRDFRRHLGAGAREWSPELHGEYRRALAQRDAALELAEIEEVDPPTAWRLDSLPDGDEAIAAVARTALLDGGPLPLPGGAGTKYEHLNTWVAALEEAGILVMATSGGQVLTSEMRALSLYHDAFPVIMVNGSDAPRGRLFSLLHEYAHLLLHTGGLCDTITDTRATDPDTALEARCNAIAAAILMPRELVLASSYVREREGARESWDYTTLRDAAAPFGVSAEAFARRLLTLGRIDREFYQRHRERFLAHYDQEEQAGGSGGNWYRNKVRARGAASDRPAAPGIGRRGGRAPASPPVAVGRSGTRDGRGRSSPGAPTTGCRGRTGRAPACGA